MKRPLECSSLDDIRNEIDALDYQIVAALGQRLEFVKAASAFKPNAQSIPAPERVAAMLPQRHRWARQAGLDPDFIQAVFRDLIAYFIHEQICHWNAKAAIAQTASCGAVVPPASESHDSGPLGGNGEK